MRVKNWQLHLIKDSVIYECHNLLAPLPFTVRQPTVSGQCVEVAKQENPHLEKVVRCKLTDKKCPPLSTYNKRKDVMRQNEIQKSTSATAARKAAISEA